MAWQHKKGEWSEAIKQYALSLGFEDCGIAKPVPLDEEARQYEDWLKRGFHGTMQYMEKTFEIRIDPKKLLPSAKSVIVLTHSYFRKEARYKHNSPKIARYAHGIDYHIVLRRKLERLHDFMCRLIGREIEAIYSVDSMPVMERAWARRAGLGWQGKNTLTITRKAGSYVFLSVMLVDVELEYDKPFKNDFCGRCNRCVEACPTGALVMPGLLDANRCISYLTIEYRGDELPDGVSVWSDWLFGCDVCQEVCPWNRFAKETTEDSFEPLEPIREWEWGSWRRLTSNPFKRLFRFSPLRRTGLRGLRRNMRWLGKDPLVYKPRQAEAN